MTARRAGRALAAVAAAALTVMTFAVDAPAAAPPAAVTPADVDTSQYTPVMIVMDTSGSMEEPAGTGGVKKIDAARAAVNAVAGAVGTKQQLGLISYPGAGTTEIAGCSSGDVLVPLADPNPTRVTAAVRRLEADGNTPTSAALEHAGQLLTASGATTSIAVLVSDGEANCGPPVCETAKKLRAQGVLVTVNTVGFDLAGNEDAAEDLRCTASATGGTYSDAGDAAALQEALLKAAASYLTLDAQIPTSVPAVTGTSTGLGTDATVTVTNTGQQQATDVQVALDFAQGKTSGALPLNKSVQSVGNLAPGASRSVTFRLRPKPQTAETTLSWVAATTTADGRGAQASGTTKVTAAGTSLAGPLSPSGPVVVLGDSYSSGEGAKDYLKPEAGGPKGTRCHRSVKAYAPVLFGTDRVTNIACSGAVTSNFGLIEQVFDNGGPEVELQSRQLKKLVARKDPPAMVLLTFGGNDIGFSGIVEQCALSRECDKSLGQDKLDSIKDIATSLTSVYESVDGLVNGPAVVARRGGRAAPIVVLPYVRLLPAEDANAPGNCFIGFESSEVRYMNRLLNELNATIRRTVAFQSDAGRPFYFADDVTEAFQPDHTICDGGEREYGNTYQAKSFDTYTTDLVTLGAIMKFQKNARQEFVHPNAKGYTAEAQALAGWAQHTTVRPVSGQPQDTIESLPFSDHPILGGIDIGVGQLQPAGGGMTVQGSGFAPYAPVVVQLQSVPRTVANVNADAAGRVSVNAQIPYTTPVGAHHLVLTGPGADGTFRRQAFPVRVLPQLTGIALLALVAGVGLVLFWAVSGRRSRRQARASVRS